MLLPPLYDQLGPIRGVHFPARPPMRRVWTMKESAFGELIWSPEAPYCEHTTGRVWVTPVQGAMWVPPRVWRRGRLFGAAGVRLRFRVEACAALPAQPCIVSITAPLRAVIEKTLAVIKRGEPTTAVVSDFAREMRDSGLSALEDPLPFDARSCFMVQQAMRATVDGEQGELDLPRTLEQWGALAQIEPVKLARELEAATGMSFRSWQRHVRLLHGLKMLAAGHGVEEAGRRAGYRGMGYWKRTFKESLGVSPGRYFAALVEPAKAGHRDSHPARPSPPAVAIHPDSGALSPGIVANLEGRALGLHTPMHQHDDGELQWPEGVMTIGTERGTWVGHDGLAVWLPAEAPHDSQAWLTVRRRFRIRPDLAARLPSEPCAIRLDPLTRQALLDLIPSKRSHSRERAAESFFKHATRAAIPPLPIPLMRPTRTQPMLDALRLDPSVAWTLADWARSLGVSRSTLSPLCERELGVSFAQLRRLMQIRRAVEWMAQGKSVGEAAQLVGYAHVPKFIAMFKRVVGVTPGKYLRMSA